MSESTPSQKVQILRIEVEVEQVHEVQFVVIENGKLIARVGVRCRGLMVATFRQLYVVPECRKRGIGKQLVMACIREAREAGCCVINLSVAANNRSVIPWYNAQGFIAALEYADGEVVMVKSIK